MNHKIGNFVNGKNTSKKCLNRSRHYYYFINEKGEICCFTDPTTMHLKYKPKARKEQKHAHAKKWLKHKNEEERKSDLYLWKGCWWVLESLPCLKYLSNKKLQMPPPLELLSHHNLCTHIAPMTYYLTQQEKQPTFTNIYK